MYSKENNIFFKNYITRNSNIELFRIVTMIMIIAHHYVVNSGLFQLALENPTCKNSYFLLLIGMWGKTGINCFVFITGYYMCQSQINIKKFIILLFEICFYKTIIYTFFVLIGTIEFDLKSCIISIIPLGNIGDGFISAYILFYLFIPYLNILIKNLDKRKHLKLIFLCLFIYTFWNMTPFEVRYNYITWFIIIYIIAAFIRIYPHKLHNNYNFWSYMLFISILISYSSVIYLTQTHKFPYYFVSDSYAIMALLTSICTFMFFKNLEIKQNKLINIIGKSILGILLIHANSDTMRIWLWEDILKNTQYFYSNLLWLHAIIAITAIFIICTIIDQLRIHFIEAPFLNCRLFIKVEKYITRLLK